MSTRSRTVIALVAGAVFGFSAALTGDALAEKPGAEMQSIANAQRTSLPPEQLRLLAEVFARVKREYVDEVDDEVLVEKAVRGMIAALDPHSTFLDRQQYADIRLSTAGSYPGVGIEVAAEGSAVKILRPIEGSPADQAGIRAGDRIVKIDDVPIGADIAGAIAQMRGPAGSTVKLTVQRDGIADLLEFSLRRAQVAVRSVQHQMLEPGYGYVRITNFSEKTPADLRRAVERLKREASAGLAGLVLDLRNNPGGVLESGVAVADAFLEEGVIVTADGRTPDARFRMDATPGDVSEGAELVVLVNSGSASCSEIVAGALRDHDRAVLIGHKTYGKGSVQTVLPLSHGGAIKLTTSRYFTPSGSSIHGTGITPDIVADGPERTPAPAAGDTPLADRDQEVALALQMLKGQQLAHLN